MTLVADLGTIRSPRPAGLPAAGGAGRALEGLLPFARAGGLIVLWQVASSLGLITNRLMPAPIDVALAVLGQDRRRASWRVNVGVSGARAISGLVVGGSIGFAARARQRLSASSASR